MSDKHVVTAHPAEIGAAWMDVRVQGAPLDKLAATVGLPLTEDDVLDGPFLRVKVNDRVLPDDIRAHLDHARAQQHVLFVTAPWVDHSAADIGEEGSALAKNTAIAKLVFEDDGSISLLLGWRADDDRPHRVIMGHPVHVGPPDMTKNADGTYAVKTWGLRRLGTGVWAMSPSTREPAHAWVVVTDVPEDVEIRLFADG